MRAIKLTGMLALALGLALPGQAEAQQDGGWWAWALPQVMGGETVRTERGRIEIPRGRADRDDRADSRDREERRDRADRSDRKDRRERAKNRGDADGRIFGDRDAERGKNGKGPKFCRNGEGHPVHGRQWCRQKGFGTGSDIRWDRRGWEDIIFGRTDRRGELREPTLGEILGDVVLGRFHGEARRLGGGELVGQWLDAGEARVLQLRTGGVPLAELSDVDRDGRVDVVLLNAGR